MADDGVVLSFHDCLLYTSDVLSLGSGRWMNDSIIEFAFEYFARVMFGGHTKGQFLFIPPGTTQFLKLVTPSEAGMVLDPLHFRSRSFTFLAVNDNSDPGEVGGTHWSLLLCTPQQAVHFDSLGSSNHADALRLTTSLSTYLGHSVPLTNAKCPKQENACDCGAYVIRFAESLADWLVKSGGDCELSKLEKAVSNISASKATEARVQLKTWIDDLAKQSTHK